MNSKEKGDLLNALTKLSQAYQVMDNGVLHTNNTTMLLYVKEFKAIQKCILDATATIKDAMKFGYPVPAGKYSVYAEVENSPLAEAKFAMTEEEVVTWMADTWDLYKNVLPADSGTNLKLEVCKLK